MKSEFYKGFLGGMFAVLLMVAIGCSGLLSKNQGVNGKASAKEDKARVKIESVEKGININKDKRLDNIGEFAYGIKEVVPNDGKTNEVISLYTDRISSLANQPSLEAMAEIKLITQTVLTNNYKLLVKKDAEIKDLQQDLVDLKADKEKAISSYMAVADKNASLADQYKATVDQMNGWFGLSAVKYGLTRFIKISFWTLVIGGVLFLILRFAAMSNPIANSIFKIFETIASWIINTVTALVPKATSVAGYISSKTFDSYKSTLTKIIDSIQMLKEKQTDNKQYTIDELMEDIAKSFDSADKDRVSAIKKELLYK